MEPRIRSWLPRTILARLTLSHVLVSLISILLISLYAAGVLYSAVRTQVTHQFDDLGFACVNRLQPILVVPAIKLILWIEAVPACGICVPITKENRSSLSISSRRKFLPPEMLILARPSHKSLWPYGIIIVPLQVSAG